MGDLTSAVDRAPTTVAFPQPGQVIARLLEFRPASADEVASEQAAVEDLMADSGATRGDLHRTQTSDFFSVVAGEVTLKADGEEVQLSEGDFAICLGAMHGWSCHTSSSARVFAVLTGARDYGDTDSVDIEFAGSPPAGRSRTARRVVLGHDSTGTARILDDRAVALSSRLWDTDGPVPTNRVTRDRWAPSTTESGALSRAQGFEVVAVNGAGSERVSGRNHTLIGIVIRGKVTLTVDRCAEEAALACGDMFVLNGFDATFSCPSDKPALVSFVSLSGQR
ncbi:cupin domain-containing protein [Acrocarpospora sp. B8E8]|uniref:cupin domain-containing protein n=1 Tax=Acrocarpospora sp. B8E8 TaxID=3153572 RepID=UPI00325DD856